MIAVILAGGFGTRLRSVLPDLPKPMAPVDGRPFLAHLLDYWIRKGCREFILSVGHRAEVIMEYFGGIYKGCPVRYAVEKEPLGTGGALFASLKQCDPQIHGHAVVMNGDTFFSADLERLKNFHTVSEADLTLSLLPAGPETRYGKVETDVQGRVLSFGSDTGTGAWINAGLYMLNVGWVSDQARRYVGPRSLERELIPTWLREGRVIMGWRTDAPFLDIGIPEAYARAAGFVRQVHLNE